MRVYALSHIHDENTDAEDRKFLGIFSDKNICEKIINKYMKLPGFCDYGKECFKIEEFVVDEKI